MIKTYEIVENGRAIKCLVCNMTSHNVNDVEHLYCGMCHAYHAELSERANTVTLKEIPKPGEKLTVMWAVDTMHKAKSLNLTFYKVVMALMIGVCIYSFIFMVRHNTGIVGVMGPWLAGFVCIGTAIAGLLLGIGISKLMNWTFSIDKEGNKLWIGFKRKKQ